MAKKPNVLVILTDQQRADTIAHLGNPIIKTPTLDRLAREGTAFRRNYCPSPVCGPARPAISMGVPPHKNYKVENLKSPKTHFPPSYAKVLHDNGYQTGIIGVVEGHNKDSYDLHLNSHDEYVQWFKKQGIDWVAQPNGRTSEYYYIPQVLPYDQKYCKANWIVDNGLKFLEERDKDKPFLLNLHFGKPHPPWPVPFPWQYLYRGPEMPHPLRPSNYRDYQCRANRYQNRYKFMEDALSGGCDDTLLRTIRAAYYASISYLDYQFSRVLEALGDEIDNTLILFSCDHAEMLGDYGCVGKRCMLEASVRVPLLVRYPGFMPEGHECRAASGTIDFMETILDACGFDVPDSCEEGISLREVAKMEPGERIVFSQISRLWNGQYFAADGIGSYIHSTADKREWYFNVGDELDQGPILEMDERGEKLKRAAIERHKDDAFSAAVENGEWKEYDAPQNMLETDPDYGFLFAEDAEAIQSAVDSLGPDYARNVTKNMSKGHPMAEHLMWMGLEEWADK